VDEQSFAKELESYRIEVDYLKHLTTLSTAAILVTLAFYENISEAAQDTSKLFYALIGFLVTIACSLYINMRLTFAINDDDLTKEPEGLMAALDFTGFVGGFIGFMISMLLLVLFVYENIGT